MTEEIIIDGGRMAGITTLKNEITRLEQKNFALTQESQQKSQTICELEQENRELKRDNKRMKAILEGCGLEENGDCTYCNVDKAYHELEQENKELLEARNHFMGVNLKYFNALEEIKEVASFHTTGADNEDVQNDMQVIIDKINECLGG